MNKKLSMFLIYYKIQTYKLKVKQSLLFTATEIHREMFVVGDNWNVVNSLLPRSVILGLRHLVISCALRPVGL